MTGWSKFCSGSSKIANPFKDPELFTLEISALCNRWSINLIVPGHEDALVLRKREDLIPAKTKIACPSLDALEFGCDKSRITKLGKSVGLNVPNTRYPTSVEEAHEMALELGFPLVIKFPNSNSAKGVFVVDSSAELYEFFKKQNLEINNREPGEFPFLQSFQSGFVVGGCFFARRGEIVGFFGERYLRAKTGGIGTSVYREPYVSRKLKFNVDCLVAALEWDGIGHFDFICDPASNELFLLEMNPRPWGAINLAFVNGFDFYSALVGDWLGEENLSKYFLKKPGVELKGLWIVGEGIRLASSITRLNIRETLRFPLDFAGSMRSVRFDDFISRDPLPLFAEMLCYGKGFLISGGNFNPS